MKLEPSDRVVRAWALFLAVLWLWVTTDRRPYREIAEGFVEFINGGEE